MFKDEKELLEKIRYFLKNEKEREKIANASYKRVLKDYSIDSQLKTFFKQVSKESKNFVHRPLPQSSKRVEVISEDTRFSLKNLKKKLKHSDYVSFSKGKVERLNYKDYLQAYSLEKSGKQMSCCCYYIYSKNLGDYLLFDSEKAFKILKKKDFLNFLNINQLMVTKSYFFKNFKKFKDFFNDKKPDLINKRNTVFVYIPLIRLQEINCLDYPIMREAFAMKFLFKLYSIYYQKKLFSNKFFCSLIFEAFKGKFFILRNLFDTLTNKDKWAKLRKFENVS